jgi:Arylsulfotransferase (ASST)
MVPRWCVLAMALVGGCTDDGTTVDPGLTVAGQASPFVPAVLNVTVDGPTGEAFIEYGIDDLALVTPASPSSDHHDLTVLGLKAGHTYQWRAVVVDAGGVRHESEPDTFEVPAAPPLLALDDLQVVVDEPAARTRFLFANVVRTNDGTAFAAILDRDGEWVWWVDSGGKLVTTPKLSLDGRSLLWNQYDFRGEEPLGKIVRVTLDGRSRTETNIPFGHHDFVEQADGTLAYLSMTFQEFDFASEQVTLGSDQISVVPEGGAGPTVLFSMFDDFEVEPVLTCDHMKSGPDNLFGELGYEWTHSNSLMYLPETGSYYVLQKYTDWLIKVAPSGAVDWFMNGREGEFDLPDRELVWTIPTDRDLWSHGHMSELWDGGGLLFDNGDHYEPKVSRAVEFAFDEAAKTVELVWTFDHPDGEYTAVMGDVRRLGDHRIITWSELGSITELSATDEVVWEVDWTRGPPLDAIIGRIVPIDDLYPPAAGSSAF